MTDATQRRLILIRHAKASDDDAAGDHARHLSPRGHEDARALGEWLVAQPFRIEQVMCSTATRTRETLAALPANLPTLLRDKLYLASPNDMLGQVRAADDAVKTLAVIGHNPGMHGLLGLLAGEYAQEADAEKVIMKFPTAACAVLVFDAAHWADLALHSGRLAALRWPADD